MWVGLIYSHDPAADQSDFIDGSGGIGGRVFILVF